MDSYVVRRIFIGMILIIIGILFLGSQLGIFTINPAEIATTYWPVILIFIGISGLLGKVKNSKESGSSYLGSSFLIVLGVGFLARNLDLLVMSSGEFFKLLIPAFIILLGIRMMFKKQAPAKPKEDYDYKYEYNYDNTTAPGQTYDKGPDINSQSGPAPFYQHSHTSGDGNDHQTENRSGFFGDLYLGHDYWVLKPMNISHFIGDTIVDLTKAQIPIGVTKLNISAFIGDVKLFVPNDMEVEVSVESSSFLGDITVFNKRESGLMRSIKDESQQYILSDKKIRLEVNLFIGDITVQRVG